MHVHAHLTGCCEACDDLLLDKTTQLSTVLLRLVRVTRRCVTHVAELVEVAEEILRLGEHQLTFHLRLLQRLHEALQAPTKRRCWHFRVTSSWCGQV